MPVDPDASMLSLWQQQSGGSAALLDVRSRLRRPPDGPVAKPEANTIRSQFPRLPNPDMVLYVFPHLNGNTPVLVTAPSSPSTPAHSMHCRANA